VFGSVALWTGLSRYRVGALWTTRLAPAVCAV